MTTAEKGFLLAYMGAPLSKTADQEGTDPMTQIPFPRPLPPVLRVGLDVWKDEHREATEDEVFARGAAGGVAGLVAGGGLSALWGKLHDKPSVARDLVVGLTAAAAGTVAGAYSGVRKGNRGWRNIYRAEAVANNLADMIGNKYPGVMKSHL